MNGSGRLIPIDALKSLAMLLVCFYHFSFYDFNIVAAEAPASTVLNYGLRSLCSLAVPLFFMVNGWLLLERPLHLSSHLRKVAKLYAVTIAWSAISILAMKIIRGDSYSLGEFLRTVFSSKLYTNNHLWFMYALLALYLLLPVLQLAIQQADTRYIKIILFSALFFYTGVLTLDWGVNLWRMARRDSGTPWEPSHIQSFVFMNPFGASGYALIYFIAGGLFKRHQESIKRLKGGYLGGTFLAAAALLAAYGLAMSRTSGQFMDSVWDGYYSLPTLAMTLTLFALVLKVQSLGQRADTLVKLVGANTLGIYFLHHLVGVWITHKFGQQLANSQVWVSFLIALANLGFCTLVALAMKRHPYSRALLAG